jgi:hypothetical protein
MSLTKLSLAGNFVIIPRKGSLVSDIPAGDGKIDNLFLQCILPSVTFASEDAAVSQNEVTMHKIHIFFNA